MNHSLIRKLAIAFVATLLAMDVVYLIVRMIEVK